MKLPEVVLPSNWICDKHSYVANMIGVDKQSWADDVFDAALDHPYLTGTRMVYEGHGTHGYDALNSALIAHSPLCCMLGDAEITRITLKHTRTENIS